MIRTRLKTISIIVFLFLSPVCIANDGIVVENIWINEAPPNVKVLAAYGKISNQSETDIILHTIISPNFKKVEIHQSIIKDDIAKMVKQDELIIAAQSTVVFEPGGMHLMLFNSESQLKSGNTVPLEFEFSNGEKNRVMAQVKKLSSSHHHHHH